MMQSSLEGKGHDFPDKSCRLILIGKTGNGKSATGNTILGKDLFQSKSGINSETKKGAFYTTTRNNLIIEVMDTPGLDDTDGQDDILREEIKKSLFSMQPGPHALLLVLRCDRRFTQQDFEVYNALKKIFGEHLPSYMIVIIVGVDNELSRIGTFEAQISKNKYIQQILNEANSRYVFVRNNASHAEKQDDVTKLIAEVRKLVIGNNNGYFRHSFSMEIESPLNLMTNEEINLIGVQHTLTSRNNTKSELEPTGNYRNSDSERISSETDPPERSWPVEYDGWNSESDGGNTVDEANTKPDDLSITSVGLLFGHHDLSTTPDGLITEHDDLKTIPDGLITGHDGLKTTTDGLIAGHDGLNTTPDGLTTGHDSLNTTSDGLTTGHDGLNTTHAGLITEHDGLNTTPDGLITGHDGLNTTTDGLITERAGLSTTPDGLITERAGLSTTPDGLITERAGLSTTPDGLITERAGLSTTPDGLITERAGLSTTPDGLITERAGLNTTTDGLITERAGLSTTPDGLITERAGLSTTPDGLITERAGLSTTPDGLITERAGLCTTTDGLITKRAGLSTTTDGLITKRAGLSTNHEEMQASPHRLNRTPLDISSEPDCMSAVTHEKNFVRPEEEEETVPCTVQGLVNFFNSPQCSRRMKGPNAIAKVEPYNLQCKYPKYAEQRRHQESTVPDDSKETNENDTPSDSSTVYDREAAMTSKRTNAKQIDNATQTDHHSREPQGEPYERHSDDDLRYLAEISVKVKIVNAPSELTKTQSEQFQKSVPNLGKKLTDGFVESNVKKVECSLM